MKPNNLINTDKTQDTGFKETSILSILRHDTNMDDNADREDLWRELDESRI